MAYETKTFSPSHLLPPIQIAPPRSAPPPPPPPPLSIFLKLYPSAGMTSELGIIAAEKYFYANFFSFYCTAFRWNQFLADSQVGACLAAALLCARVLCACLQDREDSVNLSECRI